MNLKEQVIALLEESAEDDFLTKAEKKRIKKVLLELSPDKRIADLLRSELFKIARTNISATNYEAVLTWVENCNKLILSANKVEVQQESVYFSPGEDCLNAIVKHIRGAKSRIRICLFTISDNRITEELIRKHKQGVSIKIISDNDKMFDRGSDIEELAGAGIPVRLDVTDKHMHHKFALFDDHITMTGSYNWTRSAERYNHENILVTDSYQVLRQFNKEFNSLWDEFPDYN